MMIRNKKFPNLLHFSIFQKHNQFVKDFTTTTKSGVSKDTYATFNLSYYCGDQAENVAENRERLAHSLRISSNNLIVPMQTHEDNIAIIDKDFLSLSEKEQQVKLQGVDVLITNQKNTCIAVSTADCVPILIYDPRNKIIAAIHAGWRGTVAKLAQKTISCMQQQFKSHPYELIAAIGPSICQKHFEVGEEVVRAFSSVHFDLSKISKQNTETQKTHIDLWKANETLLIETGIHPTNIEISEMCTYSDSDLFFSARRQGIHSGRLLTGGMLK